MYLLPVIDLWTMKPYAYALMNEGGSMYVSKTPNELLLILEEAEDSNCSPLIVVPPQSDEAWRELQRASLHGLLGFKNGTVYKDDRPIFSEEEDRPASKWVRSIDSEVFLKEVMEQTVRYGSGAALASRMELHMKYKKPRVQWA